MIDQAGSVARVGQSSPGLLGPLYFYFDYVSPYSYLSWCEIHNLAARHRREVVPVPVLFAGLLKAHGQKGPAEIPAKRSYVWKHVLRLAHEMGRTLLPPTSHPFNPLLALRLASLDLPRAQQKLLIDRCFAATWAGGGGVATEEQLRAILAELPATEPPLPGFASASELLAQATSDESKARLRAQTDAAIAKGVFGVPTIIVDDELFWGLDSLPHVERFLSGRDPLAQDVVSAWLSVRASAVR